MANALTTTKHQIRLTPEFIETALLRGMINMSEARELRLLVREARLSSPVETKREFAALAREMEELSKNGRGDDSAIDKH